MICSWPDFPICLQAATCKTDLRGGRLVREMVGERNTVHNKWQSGGKKGVGW